MKWRFSANAGFFGARRDRFVQYQPVRTLEEKFGLVAQVEGVTGIELKYPLDFEKPCALRALLDRHGLAVSAVNVDLKDVAHFRHGALSAVDPEVRSHAAGLLQRGMDAAAEFGAGLVTTCPLADGYDYPFQIDYTRAWNNLVGTVKAATSHRSDVRLALEYQPHEPHAHILLDNVGKVLHVYAEVEAPNLGVNLDVGHSLAAGESPAEAAALLATKGRLFYLHSNDNTGDGGDWDMMSGSVHFWHWLELLHTLHRVGYEGWIGADIAPKHMGPVEAYDVNFTMVRRMTRVLDRLGWDAVSEQVQKTGSSAETYRFLTSFMDSDP
ncbi:MAG: sugar phosphate isomerase/epimerase family protein [Candidatus Latescibacteria bacterium]|nr:sugar phosphate isomerase/epimerase family protein [Candidatus Latescibacterota bacterium]